MKSDIEIAQAAEMLPISQIAAKVGLGGDMLEYYGKYKAKVDTLALRDRPRKGRLILVTAINPTPAGEGKTTTSVGLADSLTLLGKKTVLALREPSLGPVFGVKGGAAGGGYAQVVPMEDINLHFTGDFHAIGAGHKHFGAIVGQPYSAGECTGYRCTPHHLEAVRGYERPPAPEHRLWAGRQGEWCAPGGRL